MARILRTCLLRSMTRNFSPLVGHLFHVPAPGFNIVRQFNLRYLTITAGEYGCTTSPDNGTYRHPPTDS
jgi:hypothetical protein